MGDPFAPDRPVAPAPAPEPVRLLRRAEPRLAIALASAGAVLVVLGALSVSGDTASDGDSFNRWPGVAVGALLLAAGYLALAKAAQGPIATAGTVSAAFGVPVLVGFLTASEAEPPSTEAILIVSTLAWAVTWALGPSRHRPFFLGAACVGAWLTLLELVEGAFSQPFTVSTFVSDDSGSFSPGPTEIPFETGPDWTTVGSISLVFGAVYLGAARILDRRGRAGAATPVAAASIAALVVGVVALAPDLEVIGTGLLLRLLGTVVSTLGALSGRRLSTWLGAAALAGGIGAIVGDVITGATAGGFVLALCGGVLLLVAYGVARGWDEPDELVPGPSRFEAGRSLSAWPDDDEPPLPPSGGAPTIPPHPPTV